MQHVLGAVADDSVVHVGVLHSGCTTQTLIPGWRPSREPNRRYRLPTITVYSCDRRTVAVMPRAVRDERESESDGSAKRQPHRLRRCFLDRCRRRRRNLHRHHYSVFNRPVRTPRTAEATAEEAMTSGPSRAGCAIHPTVSTADDSWRRGRMVGKSRRSMAPGQVTLSHGDLRLWWMQYLYFWVS